VTKACVGDEADATYTVDLTPLEGQADPDAQAIACGEDVFFLDLEPGDYTLAELIEGDDAAEIATTIFCIGVPPASGTSTTVTILENSDQACVFVNLFDPD